VPLRTPNPTSRPFVRERASGPFWYGKWSRRGQPVIRSLGRAWVEPDGADGWRRRRGRPTDGALTEAQAAERMLALVREHHADQTLFETDADERRRRGVTFRELAHEYLTWLEQVKGAKPSTMVGHRSVFAEPDVEHRRGARRTKGRVMKAIGDRPAREITTREIEQLLNSVAATGAAPRTINVVRSMICAAFNYGMKPSTFDLKTNPAQHADRRMEPQPPDLNFYSSEEVEALARSLAEGQHRWPTTMDLGDEEVAARAAEDAQDAEIIRIAAYAGLRRGELVALRWRDVDFVGRKLLVRRALSGSVEVPSTKSRRAREVPLANQAAAALDRLSRRDEFTSADDYVFVNRFGRRIDATALRRRFKRARDAAALEPLRFHDLRHTYGSLLVAGGIDLASVKAAMGHSRISTTERYLHARPAGDLADKFTLALGGDLGTGEQSEVLPAG
jgi:integrase